MSNSFSCVTMMIYCNIPLLVLTAPECLILVYTV